MKYIKAHLPIIILFALSILIVWPLFQPGYFPHHDDLHVIRIFEMRRCFEDFQLPCRWGSDMGYGYGFPIFNFYSNFPYYIGGVISYLLGYIGAAKVIFFLPLVLSGVFMYLLGKELYGKAGGFIAGVLYLYAPYRAVDSYVRGAVAESFALMLAPLVFYFGWRLVMNGGRANFYGAVLSLAALFTTHNIMTLFFTPVYLVFLVLSLYINKFNNLKLAVLSFIMGIGVSSYFLIPAFIEKSLVQVETLKMLGFEFRAHFATVDQIFNRMWGYGASVYGNEDGMSFQIGWPHWQIATLATIFALLILIASLFKKRLKFMFFIFDKKHLSEILITLFFFAVFIFSIFMMHNKSGFVWELSDTLQFAQFPWRFLSLSIFTASILGGFFVSAIKLGWQKYLIIPILILTAYLNVTYFQPDRFYLDVDDKAKLSGEWWDVQQRAGILDYLPKTAYEPRSPAPNNGIVVSGETELTDWKLRSNSWSITADVKKDSIIAVPVFDFPNWKVFANGKMIDHDSSTTVGIITFKLPPGKYQVRGKLEDTTIRTLSNISSVISVLLLVWIFKKYKFSK